jgi:hypothetical protein
VHFDSKTFCSDTRRSVIVIGIGIGMVMVMVMVIVREIETVRIILLLLLPAITISRMFLLYGDAL